jgi:NodT family efflux transporter outer membrane factor (OMF) lipoprotein
MLSLRLYLQIWLIITLLISALTGCMVGPDFYPPAPPHTETYTERPLSAKTVSIPGTGKAGKAQYFIAGRDISAEWWFLFHSPELNDLICKGLDNSPNLAAAEAALREAEETLTAQIGASFFPNVSTQLSGERQRFSGATFGVNSPPTTFNLYNAIINVSYTFDVFGGARRQVETLRSQVDNARFEREAAYLTLTSNIVTTAITVASLTAQINATQQLVQLQQNQLKITKQQFRLGGTAMTDVLTQETQLAQTSALLPPLEKSLAQSRHALAVLVGALPSEIQLPTIDLDRLSLPTYLPVTLPSIFVQQRPDIQASEALLHAASAQIGVATANLLPQITLTGTYGWTSDRLNTLFTSNANLWSYTVQLTQPIFNGGSLRAKRRATIAAYDQAAAQYRQTVLQAFQNVADSLRAIEIDALAFRAQKQAEVAAYKSMRLIQKQYRLGGVSYLSLLTAEQQYQQALLNRIQAQAARYTDTAALFQALGGGWWNRPDVVVITGPHGIHSGDLVK